MALTSAQIAEQKKQVEELIAGSDVGFAKALFFGKFKGELLFPYPALSGEQAAAAGAKAAQVLDYSLNHIDSAKIDREARIPDDVIAGLAKLDVYRLTIPTEYGGLGFNQQMYLKTMEVLGGHDSSVAVFVNAHHSIGARALLLFGSPDQQAKWLPGLLDGSKLCAFALTEPEAGSDAGNVQTMASPVDGGYVLNGTKHYITNGGIADVLTVMARTPAPTPEKADATKVTAFLVTPQMPGFEVVEARAEKCGIRGTATGKLRFTNMFVPKENILGPVGKGLKVALTVLDFGRTTFGASCTGHAKACLKAMVEHAKRRVQFQQPLAEFQLVQKKIAFAAAHTFAMEAATTQCAAFIDRGFEDYMLETAILKVFATEHLWTIVNDTMQVWGGKSYFCDQPLERWMRDARINTIGEGANDVLKAFVAVVGCRGPGEHLKNLRDDMLGGRWSLRRLGAALGVGASLVVPWATTGTPEVPVKTESLRGESWALGKLVREFGLKLPHVFMDLKDESRFVQAQLVHERIADIAIDLYVSSCVLARLDSMAQHAAGNGKVATDPFEDAVAGKFFLKMAFRRIKERFAALDDHDDPACLDAAKSALAKWWSRLLYHQRNTAPEILHDCAASGPVLASVPRRGRGPRRQPRRRHRDEPGHDQGRTLRGEGPDHGEELPRIRGRQTLRRADLPPRDRGLHDPRRRHGAGRQEGEEDQGPHQERGVEWVVEPPQHDRDGAARARRRRREGGRQRHQPVLHQHRGQHEAGQEAGSARRRLLRLRSRDRRHGRGGQDRQGEEEAHGRSDGHSERPGGRCRDQVHPQGREEVTCWPAARRSSFHRRLRHNGPAVSPCAPSRN
jgi:alkylation response protein AidB-like acyl-CoA dehydrogenase